MMKKSGIKRIWAVMAALLFVAIAILPALSPAASAQEEITLIISEECTGEIVHLLGLNISTHVDPKQPLQDRIDDIIAQEGGMAIAAHPMVSTLVTPVLLSLHGYTGIEIYNAEVAETSRLLADATARWDALNSSLVLGGQALKWGFAVDDAHQGADIGRAWIVAMASGRGRPAIMSSLSRGSFYGTTGPAIEDVEVAASGTSRKITVTLEKAGNITFRKMGGVVVKKVYSSLSAAYTVTGCEGYVRVEVSSPEGKAWTQPLRVRNARTVSNPYAAGDPWLKGSVHCHTRASDGELEFDEVVARHIALGYDFLAITDHNVVTVP